jgi:cytochrome P450
MLSPLRSALRSVERTREFIGFVRDPLAALTSTKDKWGDVAVLPLPGPRLIQVTRPDHVSVLLRMQHRDTLATKSLRDLLGNGLITTDSDDVRPRRRLVGRPLTPKAIASYVDDMREQTARWAESFCAGRAGESAEITSGLFALSMDMLIHSAFGATTRAGAGCCHQG